MDGPQKRSKRVNYAALHGGNLDEFIMFKTSNKHVFFWSLSFLSPFLNI